MIPRAGAVCSTKITYMLSVPSPNKYGRAAPQALKLPLTPPRYQSRRRSVVDHFFFSLPYLLSLSLPVALQGLTPHQSGL
jgi:hypothetical protein